MIATVLITTTFICLLMAVFIALDLARAWRSLWSRL